MGLPNIYQVNILGTCLCAFSTLITLLRLLHRRLTCKLWYDDLFAFFSMFNSILIIPAVWVIFAPDDHVKSNISQEARVAAFYLLEVCFTFTLWSARLSILCTVIRITPVQFTGSNSDQSSRRALSYNTARRFPSSPFAAPTPVPSSPPSMWNKSIRSALGIRIHRKMLFGIAAVFVTFALVLNAQKFWVCVGQTTPVDWAHTPGAFCSLGRQVAILEIITDLIGDLILVVIPIRLLWFLRLHHKSLHIRLVSVFGMSLVTTAVSLCQNYYQIRDGGIRDFIVSHVETYTAVFICNLNVIAGAFYHWKHRSTLEEGGYDTRLTNASSSRRGGDGMGRSREQRLGIITIGSRVMDQPTKVSRLSRIQSLSIENFGDGDVKPGVVSGFGVGTHAIPGLAVVEGGSYRRDEKTGIEGGVRIRTETVQWASLPEDSTLTLDSDEKRPSTSLQPPRNPISLHPAVTIQLPSSLAVESDAESSNSYYPEDGNGISQAVATRVPLGRADESYELREVTSPRSMEASSPTGAYIRTSNNSIGEIGNNKDRHQDYYFYAK